MAKPVQEVVYRRCLGRRAAASVDAHMQRCRRRLAVSNVVRIIGDQLLALELLWEEHVESGDRRFASLPVYGDFTVMRAWPAASADGDDDDDVEA